MKIKTEKILYCTCGTPLGEKENSWYKYNLPVLCTLCNKDNTKSLLDLIDLKFKKKEDKRV